MSAYLNKQLVLIEFDNAGPALEWFVSNEPITIQSVSDHLENVHGANWDKDSITFLDGEIEVTEI